MNRLSLEEKESTGTDVTRTRREINHDSILAPDAEIIQLKRTRNSLLNIARMPPEILGHIFRFNVAEVGNPHFAKIPKGSYNFLLVCHHWFQVALLTPELWTSWGNNLKDWRRWHLRSGISTLDLILDRQNREDGDFDEALRGALRDRAARNVIRKVHLTSNHTGPLTPIVSSLIPEGEDVRPSNIESIVLGYVDVSDLFARYRFPKLRNLHLFRGFKLSSWDNLKSTTTALTNLSLGSADDFPPSPSVVPTTSQILSLLTSNPNLRSLTLNSLLIDDDSEYDPMPQVPLRHLERISLAGTFRHVFPILRQLEFPERMDHGEITLHDCTQQEVLEDVQPYIRDYLRRDPRFRDRLGMLLQSYTSSVSIYASIVGDGHRGPDRRPQDGPPYGRFLVGFSQMMSSDVEKTLCADILALLPQESIVGFDTNLPVTEEVIVGMPNLEELYLTYPVASGFLLPDPNGPNAHKKLLPSLRRLYLEHAEAVDGNWDPLITYLTHQTSGDQAVSLELFGQGAHVCSEVIEQIEGLVEELIYEPDRKRKCPFDRCS